MASSRKTPKSQDSNIFLSEDRRTGILLQPSLNRAIFFSKGERLDTIDNINDMAPEDFNKWVQQKRIVTNQNLMSNGKND